MIRLAILDEKGNVLLPHALSTPIELRAAASQATALARECERLAKLKEPKSPASGNVPYLN